MDSYQTESMSWDDFLADETSKNQTDDNAAILPIELTNSTGTCLEKLNEDCLLEIFSCNSLSLIDLCSLAETCTRFKQITQRVFPREYGIVCRVHRSGYEFRSKNGKTLHIKRITPQTVERIMKNFGLHLSEFFITSDDQNIVNLVGKYCGDATVKNLEISGIKNLDDIVKPLEPIFQRLQKLTIDRCNFIRSASWRVPNCSSLTELKVNRSSGCVEIMECTFPNLQRFCYMYAGADGTYCDILLKFIRLHNNLTSISISVCCNELLNVIDNNCMELQELILIDMKEYRPSRRPSTPGGLAKLKILGLDLLWRSSSPLRYIPLLKVAKSLEIMRMSCCPFDEIPVKIFDVLSQLENLREFHLKHGPVNLIPWTMLAQLRKVKLEFCRYNYCDITNMIGKLINLEELELDGRFPLGRFGSYLSEKDFLEICKIVERRGHVLTLKCNLNLELKEYCDDNRRVTLINV